MVSGDPTKLPGRVAVKLLLQTAISVLLVGVASGLLYALGVRFGCVTDPPPWTPITVVAGGAVAAIGVSWYVLEWWLHDSREDAFKAAVLTATSAACVDRDGAVEARKNAEQSMADALIRESRAQHIADEKASAAVTRLLGEKTKWFDLAHDRLSALGAVKAKLHEMPPDVRKYIETNAQWRACIESGDLVGHSAGGKDA